jgi:hypothetical protein
VSWRGILGIPVAFEKDPDVLAWAEAMIGDPLIRSVTASFTIDRTDRTVLCNATGGAITATLPPAAACKGFPVTIKKTDASGNAVTVDGNASETIDGAANYPLAAQWNSVTVQSDGTNFVIIASV